MNLAINRVITCTSYTEVLLTNIAIKKVHYLVKKDKMSDTPREERGEGVKGNAHFQLNGNVWRRRKWKSGEEIEMPADIKMRLKTGMKKIGDIFREACGCGMCT